MRVTRFPAMLERREGGGGNWGATEIVAHLEEGIWFVSCLLHGLKQCEVTPLVFLNILPHMWQQD